MYMLRRQPEAALQSYRRGLRFDPDNSELSKLAAMATEALAASTGGK
jgi:cytochrome c-type biogenesis protein CcmH/NrfG